MRFRLLARWGSAIVVSSLGTGAFAAAFQNGSFEAVTGGVAGSPGYYTGATGWAVDYNGGAIGPDNVPDVVFTSLQGATNGSQAVAFNADGSNGVGILYQTFSTTPNTTYAVSFDYGQYGQPHGTTAVLRVDARGAGVNTGPFQINPGATAAYSATKQGQISLAYSGGRLTVQDSGSYQAYDGVNYSGLYTAAPNLEFSTFNFTFTAASTTSTLVFTDLTGNNSLSNDGMFDNVRVTAVPEPVAATSLGSLCVLLGRRRKGQRQL